MVEKLLHYQKSFGTTDIIKPMRLVCFGKESQTASAPAAKPEAGADVHKETPKVTPEDVTKAKADAEKQIADFRDKIKAMKAQAGNNPNKTKAAELALQEVDKLEKSLKETDKEPNLEKARIDENLAKINAILEYPAEKAKLDKRIPDLLKKKEKWTNYYKDSVKANIEAVLGKTFYAKVGDNAKNEFKKLQPGIEQQIMEQIDKLTVDINANTASKYTLEYVSNNPQDALKALNGKLDDQEKMLNEKEGSDVDKISQEILTRYNKTGESICIVDVSKKQENGKDFLTTFDSILKESITKACKDNKVSPDSFLKQQDALYDKVNKVLEKYTNPDNPAARAILMAYYKDAGNVIYSDAKGEKEEDYTVTQMTFERSGADQALAKTLADGLGVKQETFTGTKPPETATAPPVSLTEAIKKTTSTEAQGQSPEVTELINMKISPEMAKYIAASNSEYKDALIKIARDIDSPSGAQFQVIYNKFPMAITMTRNSPTTCTAKWNGGDVFFDQGVDQAIKWINEGNFLQSLAFRALLQHPSNPEFKKTPESQEKYPRQNFYKDFESGYKDQSGNQMPGMGDVTILSSDESKKEVVMKLDWKGSGLGEGNAQVTVHVAPHGLLEYKLVRNYAGIGGGNERLGCARNFYDLMNQLRSIKDWAENKRANEAADKKDNTIMVREMQRSIITDPRMISAWEKQIGRVVYFGLTDKNITEVMLDWGGGASMDLKKNPAFRMWVNPDASIGYLLEFQGEGQNIRIGPAMAKTVGEAISVVYQTYANLPSQRAKLAEAAAQTAAAAKPAETAQAPQQAPGAAPQTPSAAPQAQPIQPQEQPKVAPTTPIKPAEQPAGAPAAPAAPTGAAAAEVQKPPDATTQNIADLLNAKKNDDAIKAYESAEVRDVLLSGPDVYIKVGEIYRLQNKPEQAFKAFEKAFWAEYWQNPSSKSKDRNAQDNFKYNSLEKMELLENTAAKADVLNFYSKVDRVYHNIPKIVEKLKAFHIERPDYKQQDAANEAVANDKPSEAPQEIKDQISKLYTSGKEKMKIERWEEALADFQKADEALPYPSPKYRIAQCLEKLDRHTEALKAYKTFVEAASASAKYAEEQGHKEHVDDAQKHIAELEPKADQQQSVEIFQKLFFPKAAPGTISPRESAGLPKGSKATIPQYRDFPIYNPENGQRETISTDNFGGAFEASMAEVKKDYAIIAPNETGAKSIYVYIESTITGGGKSKVFKGWVDTGPLQNKKTG